MFQTDYAHNKPFYWVLKNAFTLLYNHEYKAATADLSTKGSQQKHSDIPSVLLHNGNFIFAFEGQTRRKMVLTRNDGEILQSGHLNLDLDDWKDPFVWKIGEYTISNFNGMIV